MEYFKQAVVALLCSAVLLFVILLLVGCANPQNHNNVNISVAPQEQSRNLHRELMRNCTPRSKCPTLWHMMENHLNNMDQSINNIN